MLKEIFLIYSLISVLICSPMGKFINPRDDCDYVDNVKEYSQKSTEFWYQTGQQHLRKQIHKKFSSKAAKNLIIIIADGMSIATQTATRIYMGNEEINLSFEEFPYVGLTKTYCVNYQVPDSACTATALLSGIKNNFGVLSMNANVPLNNCSAEMDNGVDSIFKYAQSAGKATGIVTNTKITDATVAAAYAKSSSRYWESEAPDDCRDIALQLVDGEVGRNLTVILGGGFAEFLPKDSNYPSGMRGVRSDNRDLITNWTMAHQKGAFISTRAQLDSLDVKNYENVLGLFSESHMQYHLLNDYNVGSVKQPTLMEMSQKALQMVSKNQNGYVLLIESGRIDHAHHENKAKLAMEEVIQLHDLVKFIRSEIDEEETLMVVTADHSHTMTISGYPVRGNDILSLADFSHDDDLPYFTLSYANGKGYHDHTNETDRKNPIDMEYDDVNFMQPSLVPLSEATHEGSDVGVYAVGVNAHLFTGVYEQHYIAHAMMYATCLGPDNFLKVPSCNSASGTFPRNFLFLHVIFMVMLGVYKWKVM